MNSATLFPALGITLAKSSVPYYQCLMLLIDSLKSWFEKHVRFATWRDVETTVDQPHNAEIRFSTERFTYTISAEANEGESYLGCVCVERSRRRGCDLPDGPFSEATWAEIVQAITENEIIPTRGRDR